MLPVLGSVFPILLSLTVIWIPKMILDLIEKRADLEAFLLRIVMAGAVLLMVSAFQEAATFSKHSSCSFESEF